MVFNSFSFLVFLPLVFIFYWSNTSKKPGFQNHLLLAASYFFYAWWDYRFLLLLLFSTLLGYFTGLKITTASTVGGKKIWLRISIFASLGILFLFKYYNFFAGSFSTLLSGLGFRVNIRTLNIILPLGISFYTFHGLSYVLDIYNEKVKPTRNLIQYGVFVSFFPLLVAGPIERAGHLLPQIQKKRYFNYAMAADGLRQILWGFFKKVVIADTCALYVNMVFGNDTIFSGSTVLLAAMVFAMQIYCDFSGYSDIALGTAKLFGIELINNFNFPFFSKDISEFWRRWHISLTSLATEYLYTPLSIFFRNHGRWGTELAILINFTIIGIWHGANYTFVLFGFLHGCYFIPVLFRRKKKNKKIKQAFVDSLKMIRTFLLATFAWIIFRADTVPQAIHYFSRIFSASLFSIPQEIPLLAIVLIIFLLIIEWHGRKGQYGIQFTFSRSPKIVRWSFYYCMLFFIHRYFDTGINFIYFQF